MEKICERCGCPPPRLMAGPFAGQPGLLDYCANCSKDLCENCMKLGCCGQVPAQSGDVADGRCVPGVDD